MSIIRKCEEGLWSTMFEHAGKEQWSVVWWFRSRTHGRGMALTVITTINPPKRGIHMDPTPLAPQTIFLPTPGSAYTPGKIIIDPIGIQNSDGTQPTVSLDNVLGDIIIDNGIQPSSTVPGDYSWSGTAANTGTVTATFSADGVPNYTQQIIVQNAQDETLQINQTAVQVLPPAPPQTIPGTVQAVPTGSVVTKPPLNQGPTPVAGTPAGDAAALAGGSVTPGSKAMAAAPKTPGAPQAAATTGPAVTKEEEKKA